jgi:ribonuclease VapC
MVIDTSVLLAILQNEPERRHFTEAIEAAQVRFLSAVNYTEAATVIFSRHGDPGVLRMQAFLVTAGIEVHRVEPEQAEFAFQAHRQFGKGRHPAKLNIRDCFAYALAQATGEPLLYKGDDFARTDITAALAPGG